MGTQRFNAKKVRRMAAETGVDITRAWTAGHGAAYVATRGHVHGVYFFEQRLIIWDKVPRHYDTCAVDGVLLAELEPW